MATAMYLRNQAELAAAARVLRQHGFKASAASLKGEDRYVTNIVSRYVAADAELATEIGLEIAFAVQRVRALRERERIKKLLKKQS